MRGHLGCVSAPGVLRLRGDVRLFGSADSARRMEQIGRNLAPQGGRLLLDLTGVTHLDSAGMAALARIVDHCGARGISLRAELPGGSAGFALRAVRLFDRSARRQSQIRRAFAAAA